MSETYQFEVEKLEGSGSWPKYRATEASDYNTYGYGETPWDAIAQACEQYAENEAMAESAEENDQ